MSRRIVRSIASVALAVGLALNLAACDQATIDANMQKARDVAAAIKRGAAVTAAAIRQGIDAACANQDAVYTSAMVTRTILSQQIGPNTTQNLANLDRALAQYNAACAAASDPSRTDLAYLLNVAITAYTSVKITQQNAGVL
jgi:hypothetical protein